MAASNRRSDLAASLRGWRLALRLGPVLDEHPPDILQTFPDLVKHPDVERADGGWVYEGEFYPDYLHMGGASHLVARVAAEFCEGRGADVGAGLWPLPGAIPVDVWRGPGAQRSIEEFEAGELDYVFSSHCLEHIEDWQGALDQWSDLVRPGGTIFLYLPHPESKIWAPGSAFVGDAHVWAPSPSIVKEALGERGFEIRAFDDGPDHYMSFYVCGKKADSPE